MNLKILTGFLIGTVIVASMWLYFKEPVSEKSKIESLFEATFASEHEKEVIHNVDGITETNSDLQTFAEKQSEPTSVPATDKTAISDSRENTMVENEIIPTTFSYENTGSENLVHTFHHFIHDLIIPDS